MTPSLYLYLALTGYFGLFALIMAWPTILVENHTLPTALILLVAASPLLLLLRGLLNLKPKAYAWAGFVSLLYFAHGATEGYANADARAPALAEILFSLMMFFGSAMALRARKHPR